MIRPIIVGIFVLLSWTRGFSADTMVLTVDKHASNFQVSLPGNPTTGYRWVVKRFDASRYDEVASRYVASSAKLIGSGGSYTFTFKLKKGSSNPKQTKLTFCYARSWEKNGGIVKEVNVIFEQLPVKHHK